jgi:nitrate/TMAO reductase-like tetraheme cytochrome c subunit
MRKLISDRRLKFVMLIFGFGLVVFALGGLVSPVAASPASAPVQNPFQAPEKLSDNAACLFCHEKPGMSRSMPSGETLLLTIDSSHFTDSAHKDVACSDCHSNIASFPHPELQVQSIRDFSLQLYTVCQKCHEEQYNKTLDSAHMRAVAVGNTNAAICTDCHNPHSQPVITDQSGALLPDARLRIPETCARCHNAIYDTYKQSVHGAALTQESNTDVPTCIDCHGVHNIVDPTTNTFRLQLPQVCAKCHTNTAIMIKYGISTQVLNTYVADFHGTTVTLFEKITPDQVTNKPVCFDCHGVHDIKRVDDPVYGLQMKQNLLKACQRCHPDATTSFPDAWMSHYIPSPTHDALVYYVNLFYKFFIPGVIGSMGIFVISDIARRLIERLKGAKHV